MKSLKVNCNLYLQYSFFVTSFLFFNSIQAQDTEAVSWEMPQEIEVTAIVETIQSLDSTINQTKNTNQKAKVLQQKGQALLQVHRVKEAKEAYQQGIQLLNDTLSETTIKILAGLGEIADLENHIEKATSYFSEAYTKTNALNSINGLLWILYHGGENYVEPTSFSVAALKAIKKFAGRYLYSKPQLALAASNWLIVYSGNHIKFVEDGHIHAGLVYRDWGQFDKALTQFYTAVKVRGENDFEGRSKYAVMLNIAAVYYTQGEQEKSLKMIKEIAKDAKKEDDDWGLAHALKDIGIILMQNNKEKASIPYFEECIPVMQKLKNIRGEGVCYANLANVYLVLKDYDKCRENLTKALQLLEASNYDQLYASTLLVKASLYMEMGAWEKVHRVVNESLVTLKKINSLDYIIRAYHIQLKYYTYKNNLGSIRKLVDSIFSTYEKSYQKSRLFESENLKVRYETEKKEVQLEIQKKLNTALQEETSLHKKLRNTMFFILLLSAVVLVLFYNKYRLQHKLVSEREKRNILEKKQLQETMNHKQRELTSMTLEMVKKNELLQEFAQNVKKLERKSGKDSKEQVKKLKDMLQNQQRLDQDWSTFKVHFDGVHPNFFEKLAQIGNLTQQDVRHCCYIKMGLATKEIAQLMNISASSVQMARYRLKKKLALNKENDIYSFINTL